MKRDSIYVIHATGQRSLQNNACRIVKTGFRWLPEFNTHGGKIPMTSIEHRLDEAIKYAEQKQNEYNNPEWGKEFVKILKSIRGDNHD